MALSISLSIAPSRSRCLWALVSVVALILSLASSAARITTRAALRIDPWTQAVSLRDQLEATPAAERTAARFEAVLNAFRRIYHDDPSAAKAPAAVAAVGDLLAEKGRVLGDARALRAALGQYEFLRQQYPNSPQVENALLLEAEICRQDLKDVPCALDKLHQVVAASPGTSFAEQAAMELRDLEAPPPAVRGRNRKLPKNPTTQARVQPNTRGAPDSMTDSSRVGSSATIVQPSPVPTPSTRTPRPAMAPLPSNTESVANGSEPSRVNPADDVSAGLDKTPLTTSVSHPIVQITGMRHWSNPTSTRIAIDLGGKVEYEAARVPNPDRIFFDLHGARLAPSLNGHQVEVIDDGYLKRIRAAQFHPDVTRVVLDVTDVSQYSAFLLPNPWRLIIDIHSDRGASAAAIAQSKLSVVEPSGTAASTDFSNGSRPIAPMPIRPALSKSSNDSTIADVARLGTEPAKIAATAGPTSGPVSAKVSSTDALPSTSDAAAPNPGGNLSQASANSALKNRKKSRAAATSTAELAPAPALPHAADPTADGQRSLVRALGLKVGRIVIDAGHGGHDSGTLGPGGIQEKDVVLDVALRVGALLHKRLGAEIVYTREDDTFIPLETRTAIANRAQADLFLSIHANSSPEPEARGVETYYLNFTSDPNALDVAARENAVSSQSVHQLSDLVRKITLKDKIDESREFAADVDAGLYSGLKAGNPGLKDRGVKKAPFVVLIGAQMPSILAEISFLTNPDDAEQLQTSTYRQRIAEALDAGVERYLRGLSGTRAPVKAKDSAGGRDRASEEALGR